MSNLIDGILNVNAVLAFILVGVLMASIVVVAAILGDSVGYEIGKRFGPRLLESRALRKRRAKLDEAQDFLSRRGGVAVFLPSADYRRRPPATAVSGSATALSPIRRTR